MGISVVLEHLNMVCVTIITSANTKNYIHISHNVWFDLGNGTNETIDWTRVVLPHKFRCTYTGTYIHVHTVYAYGPETLVIKWLYFSKLKKNKMKVLSSSVLVRPPSVKDSFFGETSQWPLQTGHPSSSPLPQECSDKGRGIPSLDKYFRNNPFQNQTCSNRWSADPTPPMKHIRLVKT